MRALSPQVGLALSCLEVKQAGSSSGDLPLQARIRTHLFKTQACG